jgi:hypothetical protein
MGVKRSLSQKEMLGVRVFQNRFLKRIFGSRRMEKVA